MSDNSGGPIRCDECGESSPSPLWKSYFCPKCEEHCDRLYRDEHHDPERGRLLNRPGIIAEYRDAGIPFRAGG